MEFLSHTLDNGLEIVAEQNARAHSLGLGFFVRAGSRDETDEVAGVSHFLEHMVFKGTPRRSADDVNREFDEMGAHYNAFTSEENTVYYAAVLPECRERCLNLLADILRPSLRQEDFDTEKQVIIEEIQMYDDQPPFGADDRCRAAYFADHPLARSVLGTVDTISALTREQMEAYFARRYSPKNIVLAAAGKLDFDRLVAEAERFCGQWSGVDDTRQLPPAQAAREFLVETRPSATQQYTMQMIPGPTATDDDRYAAKLLATIVGDDSGSRMYWEMIDPGVAEQAQLAHCEYEGAGVYMAYMSCDPDQAADNLRRMHQIYQDVEQHGITATELAQAKSKLGSRVVLSSERPRNRLFNVGGDWVHRQHYRSVRDTLDAVDAVSVDAVHQVLKKYPLSVNTTLTIGPLEQMASPA